MDKKAKERRRRWLLKNPNYWKECYARRKGSQNSYNKKYRAEHKKYFKDYNMKWAIDNNDYRKEQRRFQRYGITKEQYNDMFSIQNGRCVICGRHQSEFKRVFHIDHKHGTEKIRGLLCGNCNTMLGLALDNIDTLKNAIKYLEKL